MFWGTESKVIRRHRAAEFTWKVHSGDISGQLPEFQAFVAEPRNAREFRQHQAVIDAVAEFSSEKKAELISSIEGPRSEPSRGAFRPLMLSGVAAALVVAAVTVGWLSLRETGSWPHAYVTGVGELRSEVLPDGSLAHLNTRTDLVWIGTKQERRVRMKTGEVFFEVVHDPSRPFTIVLDHSVIRVLGTRFDVYCKPDGHVIVTVLSGTVAVEGVEEGSAQPLWVRKLDGNQQLEYASTGLVRDVHAAIAAKAIRWRDGVLETKALPFPTVVGELNRYTTKHILVEDPRLNEVTIVGTLSVRDIETSLKRVQKLAPVVTITHADNGVIVLGYNEDAPATSPGGVGRP